MKLSTEKGLLTLLMANLLYKLSYLGLKQDEEIYRHKVKKHLQNTLESLLPKLRESKKIMKLMDVSPEQKQKISELVGYEYEPEMMEDGINTELNIFTDFISIYLNLNDTSLYDFSNILINFKENKRVYTEEELIDKVQKITKELCYSDYSKETIKEKL